MAIVTVTESQITRGEHVGVGRSDPARWRLPVRKSVDISAPLRDHLRCFQSMLLHSIIARFGLILTLYSCILSVEGAESHAKPREHECASGIELLPIAARADT
jgi:hypothetical protein